MQKHARKRGKSDPSGRPAMCVRLRRIRDATGFTGQEMAILLKVEGGQPTYKSYETRTRPTREIVGMVERRLGIPAKALLDYGDVSDEEFNRYLGELSARVPKIRSIFNQMSIIGGQDRDARGNGMPEEGDLGQETVELIFRMLRQMNEKIDRNSQAIEDMSSRAKKPGFPSGRR